VRASLAALPCTLRQTRRERAIAAGMWRRRLSALLPRSPAAPSSYQQKHRHILLPTPNEVTTRPPFLSLLRISSNASYAARWPGRICDVRLSCCSIGINQFSCGSWMLTVLNDLPAETACSESAQALHIPRCTFLRNPHLYLWQLRASLHTVCELTNIVVPSVYSLGK
jgi:hypothetical protein